MTKKYFILLCFTFTMGNTSANTLMSLNSLQLESSKTTAVTNLNLQKSSTGTVLFFWASWCAFCKDVVPYLTDDIQKDMNVYAISYDEDKKSIAKPIHNLYGAIKNQYWINRKLNPKFELKILPVLILISSSGQIDTIYEGSQSDKMHYFITRLRYLSGVQSGEKM